MLYEVITQFGDQPAVVEANMDAFVVNAVEHDPAAGIEPERHRADLDLGAGAWGGGHDVATGQRLVERRGAEFAGLRVAQINVAGDRRDAADAAGRVVLGEGRQGDQRRITSYNVCYTKLLRHYDPAYRRSSRGLFPKLPQAQAFVFRPNADDLSAEAARLLARMA